jgi:hypothetical protein
VGGGTTETGKARYTYTITTSIRAIRARWRRRCRALHGHRRAFRNSNSASLQNVNVNSAAVAVYLLFSEIIRLRRKSFESLSWPRDFGSQKYKVWWVVGLPSSRVSDILRLDDVDFPAPR